jgi:tetratricopeptide (TPR) repeat protein
MTDPDLPTFVEALAKGGNALLTLEHAAEALASYDCALALAPHIAELHFNRGMALYALRRNDEALASYDRALALAPNDPDALLNRGIALHQLNRLNEALENNDRTLALNPNLPAAVCNRREALVNFDKALVIKPAPDLVVRRGQLNLLNGRFKEGWGDYEWRQQTGWFLARAPEVDAPPWRGEELRGRRLLVFYEQGLGDTIQFVRYLPLLLERGATVTFLAPANLIRLLQRPTAGIAVTTQ